MTGIAHLVTKLTAAAYGPISALERFTRRPATPPALLPVIDAAPRQDPVQLTFALETELRDPVAKWIAATWVGALVADEVGPRWAPADLVGQTQPVDELAGVLVSVELKLRDARKALAQATLHQLFADFSYIAMPGRRLTAQVRDGAARHGVGVLAVHADGRVECLVEASRADPGKDLAREAASTVRSSADGLRAPVRMGGSRGGAAPLLTAP